MTSAFGIEHGYVSKAALGTAAHASRAERKATGLIRRYGLGQHEVPIDHVLGLRRHGVNEARLQALIPSVRQHGIQSPVDVIVRHGSKQGLLSEGHHRIEAARRVGLRTVPVKVRRE